MARLPRLVVPGQPHHIIQRAHDGLVIFRDKQDFLTFLSNLREASRQFHVAIHAYVVMPDHWHLLATPADENGLARMMQWVGRKYVPYFNARYGRRGTLWQGRYRAVVLEPETWLLACSCYIELHPERAQLVAAAADYPWSSYAHHAGLRQDPIIGEHPVFWMLGNTPFDREAAYRAQVEQGMSSHEVDELTVATQQGWPLGSAEFKMRLLKQLGRRVSPSARGRPKKSGSAHATSKNDSVPI